MANVFKTGWQWLVGWLIGHWPEIISGASGFLMGYWASLSEFLKPYGLVAWGAVAIVSGLLVSFACWMATAAYRGLVVTRAEVRRSQALPVNPLAGHFTKQRLRVADFFHPFYRPTMTAKFEDCELLGPAAVRLMGRGTMVNTGFFDCEAVVIKENVEIVGATVFQSCIFDRCVFFNITFFVTKAHLLKIREQMPGAFKVISDGTAGDL